MLDEFVILDRLEAVGPRQRNRLILVVATAALFVISAACGGQDHRVAANGGESSERDSGSAGTVDQTSAQSGAESSAQACQDAIANLPAVAMFDRTAPANVSEAAEGSAGWVAGPITDVSAGRIDPHQFSTTLDGEVRSTGLQIVYANLAVEVSQASLDPTMGRSITIELPIAYLPDDQTQQANAQVEALRSACTGLAITAFVREGDASGSEDRPSFGLTRLAGAMVEGTDGLRSLDPLIRGERPLGVGSATEFTQGA